MVSQKSASGTETIRLNKFLALQLGISRREADDLISTDTVTINGELATLGTRLSPTDTVKVAGRDISSHTIKKVYIALNKPVGYVCSRRQQGNAPTIYSLLPRDLYHLKPVGRLDKDSSGLILLTNDGDFAHRMTHPSFRKTKIYKIIYHVYLYNVLWRLEGAFYPYTVQVANLKVLHKCHHEY